MSPPDRRLFSFRGELPSRGTETWHTTHVLASFRPWGLLPRFFSSAAAPLATSSTASAAGRTSPHPPGLRILISRPPPEICNRLPEEQLDLVVWYHPAP